VLVRQKKGLDIALIYKELAPLAKLKGEPAILAKIKKFVSSIPK
jgi:hypothetical protein